MDNNEFTQLIIEAEATLYHISKSILKNDSDCADAVQEAIVKAFSKLHTLRNEQYFKTWICRILIHECYQICRTRKKTVSYEEYLEGEQPTATPRELDLYSAIMSMKEKLRLVIVLHYIEGFRTSEIAGILKIPEGTVKSRLSRGRLELKSILEEQEGFCNEMG